MAGLGYFGSQTVLLDEVTAQHRMRWPSAGRREGTIVCRSAVGQKHFFVTYEQQRSDQNTYGVVAGTALP